MNCLGYVSSSRVVFIENVNWWGYFRPEHFPTLSQDSLVQRRMFRIDENTHERLLVIIAVAQNVVSGTHRCVWERERECVCMFIYVLVDLCVLELWGSSAELSLWTLAGCPPPYPYYNNHHPPFAQRQTRALAPHGGARCDARRALPEMCRPLCDVPSETPCVDLQSAL